MKENRTIKTLRPGFMDKQLVEELIDELKDIYLQYFPAETRKHMFERLTRHESTTIDLCYSEGELCVFGIYEIYSICSKRVMFRNGICSKKNQMSRGLAKLVVQHAIDQQKPEVIVSRTHSPRVYEMLQKFCQTGKIYPSLEGGVPSEVYEIAKYLCPSYSVDPETLVVRDISVYDNSEFPAPYHTVRDKKIYEHFLKTLKPTDAFMIVGYLG